MSSNFVHNFIDITTVQICIPVSVYTTTVEYYFTVYAYIGIIQAILNSKYQYMLRYLQFNFKYQYLLAYQWLNSKYQYVLAWQQFNPKCQYMWAWTKLNSKYQYVLAWQQLNPKYHYDDIAKVEFWIPISVGMTTVEF